MSKNFNFIDYSSKLRSLPISVDFLCFVYSEFKESEVKNIIYYTSLYLLTGDIPTEGEEYKDLIECFFKRTLKQMQKFIVEEKVEADLHKTAGALLRKANEDKLTTVVKSNF